MADNTHNHPDRPDAANRELRDVLDRLDEQDVVLILCVAELYDGDWDSLRRDLRDRLAGRPYVLKLGQRIRDDLDRADRLEAIERTYGVRLADHVSA